MDWRERRQNKQDESRWAGSNDDRVNGLTDADAERGARLCSVPLFRVCPLFPSRGLCRDCCARCAVRVPGRCGSFVLCVRLLERVSVASWRLGRRSRASTASERAKQQGTALITTGSFQADSVAHGLAHTHTRVPRSRLRPDAQGRVRRRPPLRLLLPLPLPLRRRPLHCRSQCARSHRRRPRLLPRQPLRSANTRSRRRVAAPLQPEARSHRPSSPRTAPALPRATSRSSACVTRGSTGALDSTQSTALWHDRDELLPAVRLSHRGAAAGTASGASILTDRL